MSAAAEGLSWSLSTPSAGCLYGHWHELRWSEPVIEAVHLTKHFGTTTAVDDLSFRVRPGLVTGFLGPNGAGKSTTMRLILGLDLPAAGSVTVNGKRYADHRAPLHEVGALLEARAFHTGRTARNHLLALAATHKIPRSRADELIGLVGLEEVARKRTGGFSLGMGQRLGLAAALLGDPATLLLDEPVNGLDPEGIRWIRTLLKALAAEGRTVFVSSHLMNEMAVTADHVIVVGRGRLIADLSTAELVSTASGSLVRVRSPEAARLRDLLTAPGVTVSSHAEGELLVRGASPERVGDVARAHGIAVHELVLQSATLEEAFLELTAGAVEYRGHIAGAGTSA
jgi:ABC-2 type transport system ATP-binding protein